MLSKWSLRQARGRWRADWALRVLTGDSEAGFLTLLEALEVVGISLATPVAEKLALLRDGVVIIALNLPSAGTLVHLKEAHG